MSNMKNLLGDMEFIEFEGMEKNLNTEEITERFINGMNALNSEYTSDVIRPWLDRNLGLLSKKWVKYNGPSGDDLDKLLVFMIYVGNKFIKGWDKSKIAK